LTRPCDDEDGGKIAAASNSGDTDVEEFVKKLRISVRRGGAA
jgi:hypothetical protein